MHAYQHPPICEAYYRANFPPHIPTQPIITDQSAFMHRIPAPGPCRPFPQSQFNPSVARQLLAQLTAFVEPLGCRAFSDAVHIIAASDRPMLEVWEVDVLHNLHKFTWQYWGYSLGEAVDALLEHLPAQEVAIDPEAWKGLKQRVVLARRFAIERGALQAQVARDVVVKEEPEEAKVLVKQEEQEEVKVVVKQEVQEDEHTLFMSAGDVVDERAIDNKAYLRHPREGVENFMHFLRSARIKLEARTAGLGAGS
ncbi:uncharacterized protein BXZ73DRAFT_75327 [Epithele typhae]|uniref:uncharacterized protein n=1 Tax=Epithele typhae TaxID=378194 RepID=UPI00200818BB|nr:uncharacterized protein BXZ73DRAFT_75327 [Epithele typhae]KAH9940781.1 hypothetical protein BXZ73DRAFT_75327 [Epithele typhae]